MLQLVLHGSKRMSVQKWCEFIAIIIPCYVIYSVSMMVMLFVCVYHNEFLLYNR